MASDTRLYNRFMNKGNEKINTGIRTVVNSGEKEGDATEEGLTGSLRAGVLTYLLVWGGGSQCSPSKARATALPAWE